MRTGSPGWALYLEEKEWNEEVTQSSVGEQKPCVWYLQTTNKQQLLREWDIKSKTDMGISSSSVTYQLRDLGEVTSSS